MPSPWIDTHCHLDAPAFAADRLAVRAAARAAGVAHCVLVAVERSNWQAVRNTSAQLPRIAQVLTDLRGLPLAAVAKATTNR